MAFFGHVPGGYKIVVDHIDNNRLNNHVSNLQLITQRENSSKDRKNGTSQYTGVVFKSPDIDTHEALFFRCYKRDCKEGSFLLKNDRYNMLIQNEIIDGSIQRKGSFLRYVNTGFPNYFMNNCEFGPDGLRGASPEGRRSPERAGRSPGFRLLTGREGRDGLCSLSSIYFSFTLFNFLTV